MLFLSVRVRVLSRTLPGGVVIMTHYKETNTIGIFFFTLVWRQHTVIENSDCSVCCSLASCTVLSWFCPSCVSLTCSLQLWRPWCWNHRTTQGHYSSHADPLSAWTGEPRTTSSNGQSETWQQGIMRRPVLFCSVLGSSAVPAGRQHHSPVGVGGWDAPRSGWG